MNIWARVKGTQSAVTALYASGLSEYQLLPVEAEIMMLLYVRDGLKASDVARSVNYPPTSFTPVIDKLVNKGMITRENDTHDRRAISIQLTEKARQIQSQLTVKMTDLNNQANDLYTNAGIRVKAS